MPTMTAPPVPDLSDDLYDPEDEGDDGTPPPAPGPRPAPAPAATPAPAAQAPAPLARPASLAEAILYVMREVPYIRKGGKVAPRQGGGPSYTFASDANLLARLHPAMVDAGLVLLPARHEVLTSEIVGGRMQHVVLRTTWLLLHQGGERQEIQSLGEAFDTGDKAVPKAQTIALKYALRQAFLIETGDDPDRETPQRPDTDPSEAPEAPSRPDRPGRGPAPAQRAAAPAQGKAPPDAGPAAPAAPPVEVDRAAKCEAAIKAIQVAATEQAVDAIAQQCAPSRARPWNYDQTHLARIGKAADARKTELRQREAQKAAAPSKRKQ